MFGWRKKTRTPMGGSACGELPQGLAVTVLKIIGNCVVKDLFSRLTCQRRIHYRRIPMTMDSNDRLTDVMHELEELRAELDKVREQITQRSTLNRWPSRIGLFAAPLIVVASWAWSAQNVDPAFLDIEKRLSALESMIRKGPGDSTQLTGPLNVIGPDGKPILGVGNAHLEILNPAGNVIAYVGATTEGEGVVTVSDQKGIDRAVMSGNGMVIVKDAQEKKAVELNSYERGGAVKVFDPKGSLRASMSGYGVISVHNAEERQVAALTVGEDDLGRVAIFVKGRKVVQMVGDGNGSGYFYLSDQSELARSILAPGTIALFDKEGNITVDMSAEEADGGQVRV